MLPAMPMAYCARARRWWSTAICATI